MTASKINRSGAWFIGTCALILFCCPVLLLADTVNWQGPAGLTIKSVHFPKAQPSGQPETMQLFDTIPATSTAAPYPVPPLAGFSPLIVLATSDKNDPDALYEHIPEFSYDGNPLNAPAEDNYVIGIFDSGAQVDLISATAAATLGITGDFLTINEFPLGGAGGDIVNGTVSMPLGYFAGGLSCVQPNGQVDLTQLVGHSNVSTIVSPDISCSNGESVTAVLGNPSMHLFTTVIRNDINQTLLKDATYYASPDVQILDPSDPSIPVYPRNISIEVGGLFPMTTASYWAFPELEEEEIPYFPTLLSLLPGDIPWGGAYFEDIQVAAGEPGPTVPLEDMRVLVDTGAQSSIISSNMVSNLSLPSEPDFTVDVCGLGGLVTDVPGYYIPYVKINATGGALEFSNAPFVVLDLESPEGGSLDGVLGMNFFWNRNIVFEPRLTTGSSIQVSEPVPYGNADFNFDGDVNLIDFSMLASAWMSDASYPEYIAACDMYLDTLIDSKDLEAFIAHWLE